MHELPPLVLTFVSDHIRSLDELQLLLTCMLSGDRWWDAESAARAVGLSTRETGALLDRFAALNLFDIRVTGTVRYQFRPGTAELDAVTRALAATSRSNPIALVHLVAGPRRSIRDFADAFRIRKDDR